jgi:hypothetical protein
LDRALQRDSRGLPDGRTSGVPGAFTLGVRGRLFVFLVAVAFVPLFTMLGLVRAARVRFDAGYDVANIVAHLDQGSTGCFSCSSPQAW